MTRKAIHIAMLTVVMLSCCLRATAQHNHAWAEQTRDEVDALLDRNETLEALTKAKAMLERFPQAECDYERYTIMHTLGKVYHRRRDYKRTITSLDSARYYVRGAYRERRNFDWWDIHVMIGEAQHHQGDIGGSKASYAAALRHTERWTDSLTVMLSYGWMLVSHGLEHQFKPVCDSIMSMARNGTPNRDQSMKLTMMKAYQQMYAGQYDEALATTRRVVNDEWREQLNRDIYLRRGDFVKALGHQRQLIAIKDSIYLTLTNQDIDMLNSRQLTYDLEHQAAERKRMLIEMDRMQQLQRQLQAEESARNSERQAANERRQAEAYSQAAEAKLNRQRMERLQTDRENSALSDETHSQYRANTLLCMMIFVLTCVGIGMLFAMHRNRIIKHKLKTLSEQLKQAHNEAIETNKVKTTFIQNMNYKVRAPLNEVIGFAQLLTSKDIELSDEERQEYSQHITDSAMQLNGLVGDILALADVESGHRVQHQTLESTTAGLETAAAPQAKDTPDGGTAAGKGTQPAAGLAIALAMLTALFTAPKSLAQNNFYKIDDECYALMMKLDIAGDEATYMRLCDDMYSLAGKKGDGKAQTISVSNKLRYYDQWAKVDSIRKYAAILRDEAKRTGYMQYYYHGYNREIEHLLFINMGDAMRLAKQMTREAEADKSAPYGLFISYHQMGHVYKVRHNYKLSYQYYIQSLYEAEKLDTRQRTSPIYLSMARLLDDYGRRMNLYRRALEVGMDVSDTVATLVEKCCTYAKFDQKSEFRKTYAQLEAILPRLEMGGDMGEEVTAFKAALDGNYELAYKTLDDKDDINSFEDRAEAGLIIAQWEGNGERSMRYAKALEQHKERLFVRHRGFEFAELSDLITNAALRSAQVEQDMRHDQLQLESQHLLTHQREMDEQKQRLLWQEQQVELFAQKQATDNRQYEDSMRSVKADREYMLNKMQHEQQMDMRTTFRYIMWVLAILIVAFTALMVYYGNTNKSLLRHAVMLRKAKSRALEAADMKNVFIQNMSHEIRTPLNAVMGFAQIMAVPGLPLSDDEKKEYSAHILNNTKMLTMLVDDILNIGEIEQGNYSVEPYRCLANEIMADAVSSAEYRAQDGVRMYYTSEVPDDFAIIADGRRVQQVLINYLTNSCKHTEQGTIHLHLSITTTPGMLTYSVADTGCGIPKSQAENIFERFTKLNEFKQGTGLGLNICRLISTKMGGRVFCDTTYSPGARFVFELPLHQA